MAKSLLIKSFDHKGAVSQVVVPNTYGGKDWLFQPYYPKDSKHDDVATLNTLNPYHLYKGKKFGLIQMNTAELEEYADEVKRTKKVYAKSNTYDVAGIALEKAKESDEDFLSVLHSTTWSLVFNKIAAFKLLTVRWNQAQENLVRAFITHGTTCYIHIINVGKFKIEPIANISEEPLFQQLYTTVNTIKDYTKAQRDFYRAKDALEKEIYHKTLIAMSELREAVKTDKLENYYDRYFYVWNRHNKEVVYYNDYIDDIEQYDDFISEELPEILDTIRTWASAFDIVIPNTMYEFITNFDTFNIWNTQWKQQERLIPLEDGRIVSFIQDVNVPMETKPKYAGNEKHYELNLSFNAIDMKLFALKKQNYMKFKQLLDMEEIHNIYTQIQWYLDNEPKQWLSDKYVICENCGHPVSINAENCQFCDAPNPSYVGEEGLFSFEQCFGDSVED